MTLDDLDLAIGDEHARASAIDETLRREERNAPGPIDSRLRMIMRCSVAEATIERLRAERTALLSQAAKWAWHIVEGGRRGVLKPWCERELLAILGTHELPRATLAEDRLSAEEHAYVVAALRAREEPNETTMEAFFLARIDLGWSLCCAEAA